MSISSPHSGTVSFTALKAAEQREKQSPGGEQASSTDKAADLERTVNGSDAQSDSGEMSQQGRPGGRAATAPSSFLTGGEQFGSTPSHPPAATGGPGTASDFIADGNPDRSGGVPAQPDQDHPALPESAFIADGNPGQGGGSSVESEFCPPSRPDSPFIADGNPIQGGGGQIDHDIGPPSQPESPFIADGNPLRGGGSLLDHDIGPPSIPESPFIADESNNGGGAEPVDPELGPPSKPLPPFIADGNPLQAGNHRPGSEFDLPPASESPFIADGNPIRGEQVLASDTPGQSGLAGESGEAGGPGRPGAAGEPGQPGQSVSPVAAGDISAVLGSMSGFAENADFFRFSDAADSQSANQAFERGSDLFDLFTRQPGQDTDPHE